MISSRKYIECDQINQNAFGGQRLIFNCSFFICSAVHNIKSSTLYLFYFKEEAKLIFNCTRIIEN